MAVVYVLSTSGKPLMPTTRCGHVRILLKEGKARVVERMPFTIQLTYQSEEETQPLYLGIDPGRTNVGVAVIREDGECVFTAQLTTRNKDVPTVFQRTTIWMLIVSLVRCLPIPEGLQFQRRLRMISGNSGGMTDRHAIRPTSKGSTSMPVVKWLLPTGIRR